jgi:hypothetical protein
MSFGPKLVVCVFSLRRYKKRFRRHKLVHCKHPDKRFRDGLRAATKWRETTQNMSFGPKLVYWAFLLRKYKKQFRRYRLAHCMLFHTCSRNGSRPATKCCETTQNMSFGPKLMYWACSLRKNKKLFRRHKLVRCMVFHTRSRNGSRVATKWRETTLNMSFGPKLVDWACLLREDKKRFRRHKLVHCKHPNSRFHNGCRGATKCCETTKTCGLDIN